MERIFRITSQGKMKDAGRRGLREHPEVERVDPTVGRRTNRISRRRTSDQKQRWLAAALLDSEPRLQRIKGFRSLPLLRSALPAEVHRKESGMKHCAA